MPLISQNISRIPPSCLLHPLLPNIQPHAQLITQVIRKLISSQFQFTLSTECISLIEHFTDEMNQTYLFLAEKIENGSDSGPCTFTCLATMLSSFIIFYRLLKEANTLEQLIDTQKMYSGFDEVAFDPDCIESENDDDISDTQSCSSDSQEPSPADPSFAREKSIFGAIACSSLIAYKLHYDADDTFVSDIYELFAKIYKSYLYQLMALFTEERAKRYPNWKNNASNYENMLRLFRTKFIVFSQEEFVWFERFGKGLDPSLRTQYDQIVNKLKILSSFNYYNQQDRFCFSLFQVEENALPKLYGKLPVFLSLTQCYELIANMHALVSGSLSLEEFQHILDNAGNEPPKVLLPSNMSVTKLQYLFPLFSLSAPNPLAVSSAPQIPSPKSTRQRHFSF